MGVYSSVQFLGAFFSASAGGFLMQIKGVREAMVVTSEQMACIKVDVRGFDETGAKQLLMNRTS